MFNLIKLSKQDAYDLSMVMGSYFFSSKTVKFFNAKFIKAFAISEDKKPNKHLLVIYSSYKHDYDDAHREYQIVVFSNIKELEAPNGLLTVIDGDAATLAKKFKKALANVQAGKTYRQIIDELEIGG